MIINFAFATNYDFDSAKLKSILLLNNTLPKSKAVT